MLTGEELEQAREEGKQLYLSHFATCPNARRHRKKEAHKNSDEILRLDDLRGDVAGAGRVLLLPPGRAAVLDSDGSVAQAQVKQTIGGRGDVVVVCPSRYLLFVSDEGGEKGRVIGQARAWDPRQHLKNVTA